MPYFLASENLEIGKELTLTGDEARHILLSHRIKIGEQIKLQGPNGKRFLCEVAATDKKSLTIVIVSSLTVPNEPSVQLILFQAIVSEKALDFIFQKATELGVAKIVLFNSKNTAAKLSADLFKKKKERWDKILMEAAKQSERAKWPILEFAPDVNQVVGKTKDLDSIFLADITGDKLKTFDSGWTSAGLIIGPEGGLAPNEIEKFKQFPNLKIINLSSFILRAETAAIAGISILHSQI